jgi:hypothetical protein
VRKNRETRRTVDTTRSRVNFFLNTFEKLGFIDCAATGGCYRRA